MTILNGRSPIEKYPLTTGYIAVVFTLMLLLELTEIW